MPKISIENSDHFVFRFCRRQSLRNFFFSSWKVINKNSHSSILIVSEVNHSDRRRSTNCTSLGFDINLISKSKPYNLDRSFRCWQYFSIIGCTVIKLIVYFLAFVVSFDRNWFPSWETCLDFEYKPINLHPLGKKADCEPCYIFSIFFFLQHFNPPSLFQIDSWYSEPCRDGNNCCLLIPQCWFPCS